MNTIADRILYEDNHLIVVNKLPSEIVQGDKTGDKCLLDDVKEYIKEKYDKPGNAFAGLVHRIDRPVSGAVVFAKTSKALSRMTMKVKDRDFRKTYLALVKNHPPKQADVLEDYLVKNEKMNKSFVVPEGTKEAKLARLSYQLLEEVIDFFPEAKRLVMQKILSASRRFEAAARKKLEAELNNGFESRVVSELEQLTDSSGTAQASVE